MKHINRYALTLASAALMCGTVAAQERSDSTAQRSQNQVAQDRNLSAGNTHATHIIGAQVKTTSGQDVGEIQDLIVSSNGNVRTAVVTVGGVLGVGAKKIGVPYKDFSVAPDGRTLYLNMSEEQLKSYPEFNEDTDDLHTSNRAADPAPARSTAPAATSSTAAERELEAREASRNEAAREATREQTRPSTGSTAAHDASDKPARTLRASEQPASALMGADVVDSSNSKVGEIKDLIVSAGRQAMAVLSIGKAAFGTGHLVAVPLDDLTIQRDAEDPKNEPDKVLTKLTIAQLEAMPEFKYE